MGDLPWASDVRRTTSKTSSLGCFGLPTTLCLCDIEVTNFPTFYRRCLKRLLPFQTMNRHAKVFFRCSRRMPGFARWRLSYRASSETSLLESGRMPERGAQTARRCGACQNDTRINTDPSDVNRFSMMVDDDNGRCRSFRTKSLKDISTTEHPLIKG